MTQRHKVFVSYYHEDDEQYRIEFEKLFGDIYVSKSVEWGDIDPNVNTETIRRKIREDYLRDSTVTVVLVGANTWKRKHVDWEISFSIHQSDYHPRAGLLGIILPTYPSYQNKTYDPYTIPPRLYDNIKYGFAEIYNWIYNTDVVQDWIHTAFLNRDRTKPDNGRPLFANNRSGNGWV